MIIYFTGRLEHTLSLSLSLYMLTQITGVLFSDDTGYNFPLRDLQKFQINTPKSARSGQIYIYFYQFPDTSSIKYILSVGDQMSQWISVAATNSRCQRAAIVTSKQVTTAMTDARPQHGDVPSAPSPVMKWFSYRASICSATSVSHCGLGST